MRKDFARYRKSAAFRSRKKREAQIAKRDTCANGKIAGIAHTHRADIAGYDSEDFSESHLWIAIVRGTL